MSAAGRGVQGIISAENPKAIYIHCCSHIINLAIVKACMLPVIRNMMDSITDASNFFNNSPKRQRMLDRVLLILAPEHQVTKFKDLCRTQWVYRHEAFEVAILLYGSIVECLEAMVNPTMYPDYGNDWNWDRDTLTKTNGLLHVFTSFQCVVAMVCAVHVLVIIKPISIKLQKRNNDIVMAYGIVAEVKHELETDRVTVDESFKRIFEQSMSLVEGVGLEPSVPRTTVRQKHRNNQPYDTPEEYYRRAVYVPFLDHVNQEIGLRFGTLQKKASQLLCLVPSMYESGVWSGLSELREIYHGDLPNPAILEVEYGRWQRKWIHVEDDKPDSLQDALKVII